MSTEERLAALEQRLRDLEDREAIAELIAAYGPFVDGGAADDVAAQWTEDGIYDVDEITMHGRDQLRAMVRSRNHPGWIKGGRAPFLGPVKVTLAGADAIAVRHSLLAVTKRRRFEEGPQ